MDTEIISLKHWLKEYDPTGSIDSVTFKRYKAQTLEELANLIARQTFRAICPQSKEDRTWNDCVFEIQENFVKWIYDERDKIPATIKNKKAGMWRIGKC